MSRKYRTLIRTLADQYFAAQCKRLGPINHDMPLPATIKVSPTTYRTRKRKG